MAIFHKRKGYDFLIEYDRIEVEKMTMDNMLKINVPDIPDNEVLGFWEVSEEEQKEIDDIISDLGIDFE